MMTMDKNYAFIERATKMDLNGSNWTFVRQFFSHRSLHKENTSKSFSNDIFRVVPRYAINIIRMNRKKIALCETKNIILLNCHWLALILLSYYFFFTDYLFIGCQIYCLFVFIYSKEIFSTVTNNGHCTLNWIGTGNHTI